MPCHLVIYHPETKQRNEYDCDEENTARAVEDDHAAKAAGDYADIRGQSFRVDWTQHRLVGFTRKRDDGSVVASGGVDGSQTPV